MQVQILDVGYVLSYDYGPIVTVYGISENGERGVCRVAGFYPYFYVGTSNPGALISYLDALGLKYDNVRRYLPIGYQTEKTDVIRITLDNPRLVRDVRADVMRLPGVNAIYEADIPFKNRFMIDNSLYGMGWLRVPDDAFSRLIFIEEIAPSDRDDNMPLRIMSLDIECYTDGNSIPNPDEFPIIMISMAFSTPYKGNDTLVLVAKKIDCSRRDVIFCKDEADMLSCLVSVINDYDPDIIAGYNSSMFDFPYITERAKRHHIPLSIGRDGKELYISTTPSGSNKIHITGRVVIDMMNLVKSNYSLRQYSLNSVSKDLLNMEKLDVSASEIPQLWSSNVHRLISYARQDARLTLRLVVDLGLLEKYIELARLTGVLLQDIISGGQSSMIENVLLREYRKDERLMPSRLVEENCEEDDDPDYQGATVIDPTIGLMDDLLILDFKSLYPTIMIAYNICYTTFVDKDIDDSCTIKTVIGTRFIRPDIKIGVVPRVLRTLLAERIRLKKLMKEAPLEERAKYDSKQYALKILLNSFYGYAGYRRARLYCVDIASTVTGIGRHNLDRTVSMINSTYFDNFLTGRVRLKVVYGDTDSVFVQMISSTGDINYAIASSIGEQLARMVTANLPEPMELVFESYAKRGLFVAKKRYALLIRNSDGSETIKMKGLETVRRDWCPLTTKILNKCIEYLLKEGDVSKAVRYVVENIKRLRSYEYMEDDDRRNLVNELILTRKYTKPVNMYKNKQPHTELISRLESRGRSVPNIGDRVPFVIVAGRGNLTDRSEDPEYVLQRKSVRIDVDYYIEHQILPPVLRILEPFGVTRNMLLGKYMIFDNKNKKVVAQRSIFDF